MEARMNRPLTRLCAVLLLSASIIAACGGDDDEPQAGGWAPYATQVERQLLQAGSPTEAPRQSLELTRVIVPGGEQIAAHTHPGMQLAVIVEGTLTYTVIQGAVQVTRAAGTPDAKAESVASGQSVDLLPGDSVIETPGMVHTARNGGNVPAVIYLSSLFPQGAPASSPAP